jgi:hypothetical protein
MDKTVNQDGSIYRDTMADSGEIEIPIQVLGSNGAELWQRMSVWRMERKRRKRLARAGYESLGFWTQYVNFFLSCLHNKQVEGIGLELFGHHFETHENGYLHGYP